MEQESIKMHYEDKIIILKYTNFDLDIDLDQITKIDYSNLYGEIVTVSALLNRIGILKAEVDNNYAREKIGMDIYEANLRKTIRSQYVANQKKITIQELDDEILTDVGWKNNKLKLSRLQKDCDMIASIYWSIKSKDDKLTKLNLKANITPQEFENEIIEGTINTIMIKKVDKVLGKPKTDK